MDQTGVVKASHRANAVLLFLLLLYICNQWARYSFIYLGNIAPPDDCEAACSIDNPLFSGKLDSSNRLPYCSARRDNCLKPKLYTDKDKNEIEFSENNDMDTIDKNDIVGVEDDLLCSTCQSCLDVHNYSDISLVYNTCLNPYEYGVLASYGYTLTFSVFTLVSSHLASYKSKFYRKMFIAIAAIGWSIVIIFQGFVQEKEWLFLVRSLLGCFEAISTPCSLSLIVDIFPKKVLATKNGVFTFGVYIGGGLSSLSILLATKFLSYKVVCDIISGLTIISAIGLVLSPTNDTKPSKASVHSVNGTQQSGRIDDHIDDAYINQGEEDDNQSESSSSMESLLNRNDHYDTFNSPTINNPNQNSETQTSQVISRNNPLWRFYSAVISEKNKMMALMNDTILLFLFLAAGLRFFGGFAIATYLPRFFERRFPEHTNELYSTLNALIVVFCGSASAYLGGQVSDYLTLKSNKDQRFRAYVPAVGSLLGYIPFLIMLFSDDFYIAIIALAVEILLAECWMGSAIAILQRRAKTTRMYGYSSGRILAMYIFIATLIGSLSPLILGYIDNGKGYFGIQSALFMVVGVSYIGSSLFFFLVGNKIRTRKYTAFSVI